MSTYIVGCSIALPPSYTSSLHPPEPCGCSVSADLGQGETESWLAGGLHFGSPVAKPTLRPIIGEQYIPTMVQQRDQ